MLMIFAPISNSNAADLEPPLGGKFKFIKNKSVDQPAKDSFAFDNSLPQRKASFDKVTLNSLDEKIFPVPLPSTIWLMAAGVFALVLIRRRHK